MTENNHLRVVILAHVGYFERHQRRQQRNPMPVRCVQVGIVSLKLIQPAAIMAAGQNAEMAMALPDDGFELAVLIRSPTPTILTIRIVQLLARRGDMDTAVSIGEVKRDISELVNRVAYGGERIVLTSRGKPKAVLVSIGDYGRLQARDQGEARQQWDDWLRKAEALSQRILRERAGEPLDLDLVVQADKADLEARHDELFQR